MASVNKVAVKTKAFNSDVWDITEIDRRQVTQQAAGYDPFGASKGKGCANCNWFVSPNSCILVEGDIAPGGMSNLYMPIPVETVEPYPVYVVDPSKKEDKSETGDKVADAIAATAPAPSMIERIASFAKSLPSSITHVFAPVHKDDVATSGNGVTTPVSAPVDTSTFRVYKDTDGKWRVFAVYSNAFKDKEKEIVSAAAHAEYSEWVEKSGEYPELWLWHAGTKSKWGKIDFIAFVDGFATASGVVDEGKEYIAEALSTQKDLGVSFGFFGLKDLNDTYILYRAFDISPLPLDSAANSWTAYLDAHNTKELEMPFSDKKKAWLKEVGKFDDATIASMESNLKSLGEDLVAKGVAFKETDVAEDGEVNLANIVVAQNATLLDAVKGLTDLVGKQDAKIAAVEASAAATATEAKKSIDEQIEKAFTSKVGQTGGFVASKAADSTIDETAAKAFGSPGGEDKPIGDIPWLMNTIGKQLGHVPESVTTGASAAGVTPGGS